MEGSALFPPLPNPLEEICTILARGYLRLLVVREKEKSVSQDEDRDNTDNLSNPLDLFGPQR